MSNNYVSRRFCFTLNNWTTNEYAAICDALSNTALVKYGIVGKERGANGTPHLQGFVMFNQNKRYSTVKSHLGQRIHVEAARGTSKQAAEYCKKEGDFVEYGSIPDNQGKRSDLDDFISWGDSFFEDNGRAATREDIAVHFPNIFLKYRNAAELLSLRAPKPNLCDGTLRPWQQGLWDELEVACSDDRSVIFYVDEEGGKGKSWFCRYLMSKREDTQMFNPAKRDDIAYALDPNKRVFVFNVPRGGMEHLNYQLLENIKDRTVFSPKYESKMKFIPHIPYVIVFCNEAPDFTKMTEDRYEIRNNI